MTSSDSLEELYISWSIGLLHIFKIKFRKFHSTYCQLNTAHKSSCKTAFVSEYLFTYVVTFIHFKSICLMV